MNRPRPGPSVSRELLNDLLRGHRPDEARILDLVNACPDEDDWFDYKAGALLEDKPKARDDIRQGISAFANAEGGFLVIGYDQEYNNNEGRFDGASAPGGGALEEWASDVCAGLGSLPPVRTKEAMVGDKRILLLATDRSPALIPVVEEGGLAYYARFGHKVMPLPPWMVTDLMIGRRAIPALEVRLARARPGNKEKDRFDPEQSDVYNFALSLTIDNSAFVAARALRVGAVAWTSAGSADAPNQALMRAIEEMPAGDNRMRLHHVRSDKRFDVEGMAASAEHLFIPVRVTSGQATRQSSAIYVMGDNIEPLWFQCVVSASAALRAFWSPGGPKDLAKHVELSPLYRQRPTVGFELIRE